MKDELLTKRLNNHLSTSQLNALVLGRLSREEFESSTHHLATCEQCDSEFTNRLIDQATIRNFDLSLEFWFRHDHPDIQQLNAMAGGKVDSESKEIIETHLNICQSCRDNVGRFRQERQTDNLPKHQELFRFGRRFSWQSSYAVAALLLVTIAIFSFLIIVNKKPGLTNSAPKEVATITPENFPSPSGGQSPLKKKEELGPISTLNDGPNKLTIYKNGRIDGLDSIASNNREEVSQALLSGRVEAAAVLKELAPNDSALRGADNSETSFKLVYPVRQVLVDARPQFRWQNLNGASSYQVFVLDSQHRRVATSKLLGASELTWVPERSLPRGLVFTWAVTAVSRDKEVVSPSASEPEVKFAVISETDLEELKRLGNSKSVLARALFLARAGLLTQAEVELKKLIELNPQSPLPRQLLKSVQKSKLDQ